MVIDLSQFDFKKKPTLVLRNPDGTAIGVLGTAYNIQLNPLAYNEVSVLEFDLSAYDAVMRTPHYDQVIGLRIVDLKGIGQFVLNNPKTTNAGAWETKHCTAYSLEREFVRKNVYLEKNVYNFWNPVSPGGTVLGIIMEKFPNWSVGKVDSDLVGKYRSLDDTDDNAYNVMKGTLQEAYGCIFDFDTYKRKVNVVSTASDPASLPVFFSLDNLIKQLEIEEDDENIVTCLGVYGADGLSIADVNPMGGAKIYNFDYFMNETNFAPATIEKYKAWKAHFKAMQEPFYNLTVEQALKESQVAAEGARLTDLQGELKALEGVQATWVELLASHDYSGKTLEDGTPADEAGVQEELDKVNGQIRAKQQEISDQQAVVDGAKAKAEQLQAERKAIVDGCQFEAFFTAEEILQLDHYIVENSIEESSFVTSEVKNYNAKDTSLVVNDAAAALYDSYRDKGTVPFVDLPAVSQADINTVYCIASGTRHYWDSVLTRAITPTLKKEASAIINKSTDTQSHELSAEFTAFVKTARDVYVEDASGTVVDDSPTSIRYLARGILSVGQRPESLTAETYFLTTADFSDGAGVVYPAGVSVAVQGTSQSKKYRVLSSDFQMAQESAIMAIQRNNGTIYSLSGGQFSLSAGDTALDANVVRASVEVMQDNTFTLSAYLNSGTLGSTTFPSGTVVLTGTSESAAAETTKLTLNVKEARFYFTQNLTEWERRSVAWDLFQYGQEVLEKVAQPSYSFTVDSADFLVMDEFEAFKNALSLGKRVYLKLDDGRVLTPLLLSLSHTFDEKSGLPLEFSNKFTSNNENDRLVDLLEQSVSMGKKLDLSREVYSAFVDSHANTAIHDFINGALDVAKNSILSTTGQAISWDENGLRLRKWTEDGQGYDPHQVWMMNENIVFTDDGWQTAKMAIGHIVDPKFATEENPKGDLWGVVAPNLIGNKLIGENCAFYGNDPDGQGMSFQFDAQGLYSYNARQLWRSQSGSFAMLDPNYGFMLGTEGNPLVVGNDGRVRPSCIDKDGNIVFEDDTDKNGIHIPVGMNLYMDKTGKLYTRGDMFANNFCFIDGSGDVKTILSNVQSDLDATKKMSKFDLSDVDVIDLGGMILDGRPGSTGIRFTPGYNPIQTRYSTNKNAAIPGGWSTTWNSGWTGSTTTEVWAIHSYDGGETWSSPMLTQGKTGAQGSPGNDANVPEWVKQMPTTYIDDEWVISPNIYGGKITSGSTIDVTTDATIGRWLKIKGQRTGDFVGIIFNGDEFGVDPSIWSYNNQFITHYATYLNLIGEGKISFVTPKLDLSMVDEIEWGNNKVHAVLA